MCEPIKKYQLKEGQLKHLMGDLGRLAHGNSAKGFLALGIHGWIGGRARPSVPRLPSYPSRRANKFAHTSMQQIYST